MGRAGDPGRTDRHCRSRPAQDRRGPRSWRRAGGACRKPGGRIAGRAGARSPPRAAERADTRRRGRDRVRQLRGLRTSGAPRREGGDACGNRALRLGRRGRRPANRAFAASDRCGGSARWVDRSRRHVQLAHAHLGGRRTSHAAAARVCRRAWRTRCLTRRAAGGRRHQPPPRGHNRRAQRGSDRDQRPR